MFLLFDGDNIGVMQLELNKPLLMFRQPVSQKVVDVDARWGRQTMLRPWSVRPVRDLRSGAEDGALHPVDLHANCLDPWFGFLPLNECKTASRCVFDRLALRLVDAMWPVSLELCFGQDCRACRFVASCFN